MNGFKQLRHGFLEAHRHRILNGLVQAVQEAAQQDAQVQLQPPTGKIDSGDQLSLQLLFTGELSGQQLSQFEAVIQRFSKPGA